LWSEFKIIQNEKDSYVHKASFGLGKATAKLFNAKTDESSREFRLSK